MKKKIERYGGIFTASPLILGATILHKKYTSFLLCKKNAKRAIAVNNTKRGVRTANRRRKQTTKNEDSDLLIRSAIFT